MPSQAAWSGMPGRPGGLAAIQSFFWPGHKLHIYVYALLELQDNLARCHCSRVADTDTDSHSHSGVDS